MFMCRMLFTLIANVGLKQGKYLKMVNLAKIRNPSQLLYFSSSAMVSDHYKTLGVERNASQEQIEEAYFRLLARHKNSSLNQQSSQSFNLNKVLEAYETLSDEDTRKVYDGTDVKELTDEVIKNMNMDGSIKKSTGAPSERKGQVFTVESAYFIGFLILSSFLIITVPKILYIMWVYITQGSLPPF